MECTAACTHHTIPLWHRIQRRHGRQGVRKANQEGMPTRSAKTMEQTTNTWGNRKTVEGTTHRRHRQTRRRHQKKDVHWTYSVLYTTSTYVGTIPRIYSPTTTGHTRSNKATTQRRRYQGATLEQNQRVGAHSRDKSGSKPTRHHPIQGKVDQTQKCMHAMRRQTWKTGEGPSGQRGGRSPKRSTELERHWTIRQHTTPCNTMPKSGNQGQCTKLPTHAGDNTHRHLPHSR